jgi:hypothetical protein
LSVSKELQLERQHAKRSCRCRGFKFLPGTSGVNTIRTGRVLKPAKLPITGGLEGGVYTLKNELSISSCACRTGPNPGSVGGKSPGEDLTRVAQRLANPFGQIPGLGVVLH